MSEAKLGVVIVTFNAGDVIAGCLESLMAAGGDRLRIVVVDNDSSDDSVAAVQDWAAGTVAYAAPPEIPFALSPVAKPLALSQGGPDMAPDRDAALTLINSGANRGLPAGSMSGWPIWRALPRSNISGCSIRTAWCRRRRSRRCWPGWRP